MSYQNVASKCLIKTGENNWKRLKTIGNGWKQKMFENGWKHLKIVEMLKTNENGWKQMKTDEHSWKRLKGLKMDENS